MLARIDNRLPLWQAALWVVLGGFAAQLTGSFVASLARSWLAHGAAGHHARGGPEAAVLAPALIATELALIAVSLIAPASAGLPVRDALGLRGAPPIAFGAAALGTIMLGPLGDALMRAMQALLPALNLGVVPMLHDVVSRISPLLAWPVFAVMPGIAEELTFRGLLQNAARRRGVGIAVSALAFSAFHLDPQHVAGVLPLGFFLAWVGSRCGTLVTIFAHIANNTVAIMAVHSKALDVGYGTSAPMPWPWLPASLLLVVLAARSIARNCPLPPGGLPYSERRDF